MKSRSRWILGFALVALAMFVISGCSPNPWAKAQPKAPRVVQPVISQPLTTIDRQPVKDTTQPVVVTTDSATAQGERPTENTTQPPSQVADSTSNQSTPPSSANQVSEPAADEVFVPRVRKPVSEMSDTELQAYLAELAFIASDT